MSDRSTDKQVETHIAEALELLLDGYSPASIVRNLSRSTGKSIKQTRRYVAAAKLDYFDKPITRNELEFGIALHIERLDRIADSAHQAGEVKQEIAAAKASAQLSEQRLKSLQREQEYITKSGSNSSCF
jgi:cell division septum initiation protein DivIVA